MPLLPKRNTLDYNPNSIINASKKVKTIALENMKNPILDPDMKTLSIMSAEKDLDSNLDQLEQMYNELVLTGQQLQSVAEFEFVVPAETLQGRGRGRYLGGASTGSEMAGLSQGMEFEPYPAAKPKKAPKKLPDDVVIEEGIAYPAPPIPPRPRGRPKGSKNKQKSVIKSSSPVNLSSLSAVAMAAPTGSIRSSGSYPVISSRFSAQPVSSSGNSQAIPYGDPEDPDDDSSSLPSSVSSRSRTVSSRSGSSIPSSAEESQDSVTKLNFIGMLFNIISKINKMNFFITSRIKPVFRNLSAKQQGFLASLQKAIHEYYRNVFLGPLTTRLMFFGNLENYIIEEKASNGDEILQQIREALNSLELNLSVVLNASRQAGGVEAELSPADIYALRLAGFEGDPRIARNKFAQPFNYRNVTIQTGLGETRTRQYDKEGQLIEGSGRRKPKMTGCGRNFYGDVINESRDIPTIRRVYQNCPTKYLL